jgi:Capsule assembly protein Wzi
MRTPPRRLGRPAAVGLSIVLLAACPPALVAAPNEFLPVGDPLEAELRVLDLLHSSGLADRMRLPHAGIRPLQRAEVQGPGSPVASPDPVRAISLARLERALARDARADWPAPPLASTPRLFTWTGDGATRLEFSGALEGGIDWRDGGADAASGTGAHARIGAQLDHWLAFTHLEIAEVDDARTFADPIVSGSDVITHTEETYLAYTGDGGRWNAQFGRSRWHFGPGDEGSLALSRTSAPMTGLALRGRLEGLRLDGIALSATLEQTAGEQLAAHRLEWQAADGLRLGLTETARYQGDGWEPLYAVGLIPYVLVQRLQHQDEPDSLDAVRNNVMIAFDAAWRIADGTRVYAEWLVDDMHAKTDDNPNKYAWQVGWEGAWRFGNGRVTWGGEYTRLSRYVYTSFFGRDYAHQQQPLGFPTGPDSRRVRVRVAWDPVVAWQLFGAAGQTDQGENEIDEPFLPGSPQTEPGTFEGVVERAREIEAGVRWWPASGVDLAVVGGWRWLDDAGHVPGATDDELRAAVAFRLTR